MHCRSLVLHDICLSRMKINTKNIIMKNLTLLFVLCCSQIYSQNIDDNFVTFNYTQLPLISVNEDARSYRFEVHTDVESANQDSLLAIILMGRDLLMALSMMLSFILMVVVPRS